MATRSKTKQASFWEENRSLVSSGLVVLIIIALGFLAFDTITKSSNKNTPKKDATKQDQNKDNNSSKDNNADNSDKNNQNNGKEPVAGQALPVNYVVVKGDSLWKLAQKYYNDGYQWTAIAKANNLTNPDVLYSGTKLTIPKLTASTPATAPSAALPASYTVVKGDNLWNLALKYYGSGYKWYLIRDANASQVGLLANGRPLIRPGSVLTIPKI